MRFGPADRTKPAWFRELPQSSYILQVSGVGGTTQHYYANCPRAYPGVFAGYAGPDRDSYDTAHRFPFTYQELVPYYEWVEATLPVQTAAMGRKERVFFDGCEALGLPVQTTKTTLRDSFRPQENAILQPGGHAGLTRDPALLRFPLATGCTFCGYCMQGCMQPIQAPRNLFAKRSTDNSYVPMALTADAWAPGGRPITLVTDAFATRVHTELRSGEQVATAVTWRVGATGEQHTETARVIVMAAGATETPRLWLNSELPNPNDWVGRGYTNHYFDFVVGLFDRDTDSSKGPASAARADFPGRGGMQESGLGPSNQAFAMQLSDSGSRGYYTNGRGMTGPWDGPAGRPIGPELKDALMNGVNRMLNILVLTDDDVEAQNRVVRSALPPDEHGPVPKVIFQSATRSARTRANREFLARKAAEILRGAGARKVLRLDWAPLILHTQSSMRMGHDAADSVLDADAEARWVKRLFIADNSALANALGGPNPTLTTQAVATRTAEKIFQRYFGGAPWVGQEAPISSIDPAVTQAVLARGL
ncbi:MAG TPA: GMC family oxidoreductase N-terminal domain-containing protein [Kofleriaceae bacterium]|nr:GMC family oxidoreductase N-terminal domain-containing protein [Kofleriaceae bacterium]